MQRRSFVNVLQDRFLANFAIFTGKHLCWSLFLKLYCKGIQHKCFAAKRAAEQPFYRIPLVTTSEYGLVKLFFFLAFKLCSFFSETYVNQRHIQNPVKASKTEPLTIFAKHSFLDVWQGFQYISLNAWSCKSQNWLWRKSSYNIFKWIIHVYLSWECKVTFYATS